MLQIIGPAKQCKNYTNLPMHDGIGKVTAYVRHDRVGYRPLGGTKTERITRARIIAANLGGVLVPVVKKNGTHYVARVDHR